MYKCKSILIVVMTLSIPMLCSCKQKESCCDDTTARLVARAYVMSIPILNKQNNLIPLVNDNSEYFAEGGKAIKCMQALGNALLKGGLAAAQQTKGYSATERFGASMPPGLEHLPGQVDDNMRSYGSDMFAMGQELLWLSQVLPPLTRNDYTPYNTPVTVTRQMANQALPMYQTFCQIDPGICGLMQNMMQQMEPVLEEEVYRLARQLYQ